MNSTARQTQTSRRKYILAIRMILTIIVLVILLLSASWTIKAGNYQALTDENLPLVANLVPNATITATAPAKTASINKPTVTKTPSAIATNTSIPTATHTVAPSSTPETMVKFLGDNSNLRTGPGTRFAVIRKLTHGEMLRLLGRTSDNSWIYIMTENGQEGWIRPLWIDLAGVNIDSYAIEIPSVETTVKVLGGHVNLRTGPGYYYSKVLALTYGDMLTLLGRLDDNTWLFVRTTDGQEGWIKTTSIDLNGIDFYNNFHPVKTPPPTETATPVILPGIDGHWIDIDLGEQMLYAYDGTSLVSSFLVSTGIDAYPTVTGRYHIYAKFRYSDMRGSDYFLPDVPWTMYYDGDFSIHGTYWHHSFGTPMSHGCINMDISDAEWLYSFAAVDTLVNIHH